MEPLVTASGLAKSYKTRAETVHALRGIDLSIAKGEFVAVTGPSGSGKTTLLHCLSGIDEPDEGRVTIEGRDLFAMTDGERTAHRAATMGFVFQGFHLIPVFSALENVALPLLLAGKRPRRARSEAADALDRVGLSHRGTHRPGQLSGGEQQRVAIARAIVWHPRIIWADEPTGNLDSDSANGVVFQLEGLVGDGLTLVLVTHDPALAARAGRQIQLHDGRLAADFVRS